MGKLFLPNWPNWLNWIEHQTSNLEVTGSSPVLGGNVLEWVWNRVWNRVWNGFAYLKLPKMLA